MSTFFTTMLVFAPRNSKAPERRCLYSCGPFSLQPTSQTRVPTIPLKLRFVSPKNISALFLAKTNGQLSILTEFSPARSTPSSFLLEWASSRASMPSSAPGFSFTAVPLTLLCSPPCSSRLQTSRVLILSLIPSLLYLVFS